METNDDVIYIQRTLPELGLIKGNSYKVYGTLTCNCKDNLHIDVGIEGNHSFVTCPDCGAIVNIDDRWSCITQGLERQKGLATEFLKKFYQRKSKA